MNGMFFARSPRDMQRGDYIYDSRRPKLTADPFADPPHIDIKETDGGSDITISQGEWHEETLFEIEHNLTYVPHVWVFFNIVESPNETEGAFSLNSAILYPQANFDSEIRVDVDEDRIKVERVIEGTALDEDEEEEVNGSDFTIKVRYIIFNREYIEMFHGD